MSMRGERAAATLAPMRASLLVVSMMLPSCAALRLTSEQMISTPPKRLALASPEPRRTVTVLGVELAVHDSDPSGGKPAIFCLHAVGHGGSDFAAFEQAFADRYRILTLDWPGHGASGADPQPASAIRYAELFDALVQQLDVKSMVLLGNPHLAAVRPGNGDCLAPTRLSGCERKPDRIIDRELGASASPWPLLARARAGSAGVGPSVAGERPHPRRGCGALFLRGPGRLQRHAPLRDRYRRQRGRHQLVSGGSDRW